MSKRREPTMGEMMRIMRLLADVAALKPRLGPQRQLLIDGINDIIGTNQSFLYVAEGWRAGDEPRFIHRTLTTHQDPVFLKYMADFGSRLPLTADPFGSTSIGDPRPVQVWTFADVLPDLAAERSYPDFMEIRRGGRVSDGVVSFYRDQEGDGAGKAARIIGVGMHQFGAAGRLCPRQLELVRFAITEIRDLVRRGHLGFAPVPPPLPPRLQEVLEHLLAGHAPKAIARKLELSLWTVREHIQRLYKHFDVSGRDELMARLLPGWGKGEGG
jgi:DNA-binding CsgD family transcriptional regulator